MGRMINPLKAMAPHIIENLTCCQSYIVASKSGLSMSMYYNFMLRVASICYTRINDMLGIYVHISYKPNQASNIVTKKFSFVDIQNVGLTNFSPIFHDYALIIFAWYLAVSARYST